MKRFVTLSALAVVALLSSCNKTTEEPFVKTEIKLSTESAEIPQGGGEVSVTVTSNAVWSASASQSWVSVTPASGNGNGTITLKAETNSGPEREAVVTVKSGVISATLKLTQGGVKQGSFSGKGTASDPYIIGTSSQLVEFSTVTNSTDLYAEFGNKCFALSADLDMSGVDNYIPAAQNPDRPFKGTLDGSGHSISKLTINSEKEFAAGLVAYADGATLKGLKLKDANIDSKYVYCGSIAGYASNSTTIKDCSVSGKVRQYTANITIDGIANSGLSGGIAGYLGESTMEGCTVDADVTFYGKFSGGAVGYAFNSTVSDCHYLKERTLNIYYHFSGGIVGRARGEKTLIKGCSFEANYTTVGYVMGGIVGQIFGGKVEKCVLGSYATVGGDKYFVGGIAGTAQPENEINIDHCACYGTVRGAYSVGGIVGYSGYGSVASDIKVSGDHTKPVTISNCAMLGGEVTATNGNSSKYPIAGGILGWSHGANKCTICGCYSQPGLIQTTFGSHVNAVLSGICSYQNSTVEATIENCYSSFTPSELLVCNDPASIKDSWWYAAIAIRCTQATTVRNCFSENSLRYIYTSDAATVSGCGQYSFTQMTDGTLLTKLQQTAVSGTQWVVGTNGLPAIDGLPSDPNVKPRNAKRVSVIGDSISTFKGWIPGGYAAHYPATDGTLTLVNETYWYRLIHDYMKNAQFDTNIAYSGSTVTNTTEANYRARYGTASNSWWHNSFVERFAACGGCGKPDIILIHGGTNDWAHNADPLAPGVVIRNDASNIYGGHKPSATIMSTMYTKADAAKTRAEVNALPDGSFCEAYIKLMCQIRERYPKCKVVCIIGDYLSQSTEESIIDIAAHYGAKTVNLFRVNGFNDLGGYSPESLTNKGKQPNMPKHDYSGDISGCHPGSEAMKFMAEKIYKELGTWLEE